MRMEATLDSAAPHSCAQDRWLWTQIDELVADEAPWIMLGSDRYLTQTWSYMGWVGVL